MSAAVARTIAGALAVACGLGGIGCSASPERFAGYRQARSQEIPGTFGYELRPTRIDEPIDPTTLYPDLIGSGPSRDVSLTLADVENPIDGIAWGPAWVFFTRGLCYFTAKGDFVSPSRAGDDDTCTDRQMLVQVVDARTGTLLGAFDAYDPDGGWRPAREPTDGEDQAPALTRFH
jgi:hypothetical protein